MRVTQKRHDFRFGTAVRAKWILETSETADRYRAELINNFNEVVLEDDLKLPAWIGLWGADVTWDKTREAVEWLAANDLPVRGHYLSWATWSGVDAWGDSEDTSGLPDRILRHITEKLRAVGSGVYEWDVINHPVGWMDDTYENRIGDRQGNPSLEFYGEIIDHSRRIIRELQEEGRLGEEGLSLWINEDDVIAGNSRADEYERVIRHLVETGSPPDGIGFQAHFAEEWNRISTGDAAPEELYERIERFAKILPRLRVTELDIDVGEDESRQAELLGDYLTIMFSHPQIEAITMWGFWAGSHWRPAAALLREDWSEKPAMRAYRDLVFDAWWSRESAKTDDDGAARFRVFKGEYEIVVSRESHQDRFNLRVTADVKKTLPIATR